MHELYHQSLIKKAIEHFELTQEIVLWEINELNDFTRIVMKKKDINI